jgi:NAD(P)H-dependent FMN reductase
MTELRIGIILGSTRPGRRGEQVAKWVLEKARAHGGAQYELIDLADFPLPHLDEAMSPAMHQYANEHTKAWSREIESFDGFVMVTPEYNRSTSGVLKNAIDYLHHEWNDKAVGFVSYGAAASGLRAVEHLRVIVAELQMADVRTAVGISLVHDFENYTTLRDVPHHEQLLKAMLDQVTSWSSALRTVREAKLAAAA